jgi:atlastin
LAQLSQNDGFDKKLFQQLIFLIRDWPNQEEYDYGFKGGNDYLKEEVLKIDEDHQPNMKELRRNVKKPFEIMECFLMPHPGFKVSGKNQFDGRWSDINTDFMTNLKVFIPKMLSPENLILKKILGRPATAQTLYDQIKEYRNIFNSDKVPNPKALHEVFAEGLLTDLIEDIFNEYEKTMEDISKKVENMSDLQSYYNTALENSKSKFNEATKIGDSKMKENFLTKLINRINDSYEKIKKQMEATFNQREMEERYKIAICCGRIDSVESEF